MDLFSKAWLVEHAEIAFFAAMREGYASESPSVPLPFPIPNIAKGKTYCYRDESDKWVVYDSYVFGDDGASAGWTIITYRDRPVWQMQYDGWYAKEASPFLKKALRVTYAERRFVGGRGPELYTGEDDFPNLAYLNVALGHFQSFSGSEGVRMKIGSTLKSLGEHHYRGGMLWSPRS